MRPVSRSADDYPNHVEPPVPIRERRLSGVHWWDPDRIRHVDDRPQHCPSCGVSFEKSKGIAVEYWESDRRVYHIWCDVCGWAGDVTRVHRMVGPEAEH